MAAQAFFFWIFATILVASALAVVLARNPVHSVLFLILAFVNASGLFVLLGAEFLAMMLVVVYVGAVAVLFLFVVMLLDVDFAAMKAGFVHYLPVGGAHRPVRRLRALVRDLRLVARAEPGAAGLARRAQSPTRRRSAASSIRNTPMCSRWPASSC